MKKTIILNADQLALLKDGKQVMLCTPLVEQPPDGSPQMHVWDMYDTFVRIGENLPDPIICDIPLKLPKDTVLKVKGTDTHVKVVDTSVKKVRDVTEDEARVIGNFSNSEWGYNILLWFQDWFNVKYSKPRARRKKGKIIGYECWGYNWDSWAKWCYENHKGNYTKGDWKGKDLTIYPDPFVELTTVMRVK